MSGSVTPDPRDGPGGLIVMVRDDPDLAARALARDLHADLAIGGSATTAALDRLQPAQPDDAALERLGAAMRRAEGIQTRTRDRLAAQLARTLNTDMAIHPDTIRRAAGEYLDASAAAARARSGRGDRGDQVRATFRVLAGGLLTAAGITIAVVALPLVGIGVAVFGVISVVVTSRADRAAITTTLPACEALEALARRRWEQVAGADADPHAVESVIHRYDPQQGLVADLVGLHPAVRAADRAARAHRMAWVRAWRQVIGDEAAPEPANPALRAIVARDATELWLSTTDQLPLEATTLVVSSPYADLDEDRAQELHRRLLTLPAQHRVIVVLAPETRPTDTVIDLTEGDAVGSDDVVIELDERQQADHPR